MMCTFATEEADCVIITACAVHGNKWASSARLLVGRTGNATKNHWNFTLRHRCSEAEQYVTATCDALANASVEKAKGSSEETPSIGDIESFESLKEEILMQGKTFLKTLKTWSILQRTLLGLRILLTCFEASCQSNCFLPI